MLSKSNRLYIFLSFFSLVSSFIYSKEISFRYNNPFSKDKSYREFSFDWDEKWFGENSSYNYNHKIARVASLFSLAAYSDSENENNVFVENYGKLGVSKENVTVKYNVDYNDSLWGNDQVAFSIASKEIDSAKGKRNLIFVTIRGTPLNANEWISNLNIDDTNRTQESFHKGFAIAASLVHAEINSYLLQHRINPENSFMLVTGHSRGAAVSNILAKEIHDEGLFNPENIYCYTFASPNTSTSDDVTDPKYQFIFNIVNAEDIVPTVPINTGNWRFRKYGKTLTFINAVNTDQVKYSNEILPEINKIYTKLADREYCPFKAGPFIPIVITKLISSMNEDVEKYYKRSGLHRKGTTVFNALFPNKESMERAKKNYSISDEKKSDEKQGLLKKIIGRIDHKRDGLASYMANAFSDMHACIQYVSCMFAFDEEQLFSDMGYTILIVHGSSEGAIFDEDGTLLARIMDGRFKYFDARPPVFGTSAFHENVILGFPPNRNFTFVLTDNTLLSSPARIHLEHYDSAGVFKCRSNTQTVHANKFSVKNFELGEVTLDAESVPEGKMSKAECVSAKKNARLDFQNQFMFSRESFFSTNAKIAHGFRIGNPYIYGVLENSYTFGDWAQGINLCTGLGTQLGIWRTLTLDMEVLPKFTWGTENAGDFSFMMEGRATAGVRVFGKLRVIGGASVDVDSEMNVHPEGFLGLRLF